MGKITLVSEFRFSTTIWLIAQKRVFFFFTFQLWLVILSVALGCSAHQEIELVQNQAPHNSILNINYLLL